MEQRSSNFISATSNILETHSSNFTNALRADVNKWINEENELSTTVPPVNITHTYIYNSNFYGEIRFKNRASIDYNTGIPPYIDFPPGTPDYKVKIDIDID